MNTLDYIDIDFVLTVTPDYQKSQVHQPLDQKYELLARSYRFGLQMISVFSPTYTEPRLECARVGQPISECCKCFTRKIKLITLCYS